MTQKRVYIAAAGIVSPLGAGLVETELALRANRSAIGPLKLFSLLQGEPLPVGAVQGVVKKGSCVPRTHQLALLAAEQALLGEKHPPEAIIIGTTTGGIATTEQLLRHGDADKEVYSNHGLHSVACSLAEKIGCTGPALTVSTACSSGAVAIAMGLQMLRSGTFRTVLVGGVDSLCRLTYYGFFSLQLVDRTGCKPLDRQRQGMAVAEGAGMLLLTTTKPAVPLGELLGAGLSCDAYHAAAPHPEGQGAYAAMRGALADAGLQPGDIDYINLHGTGTPDNDLAESKAVRRLFTPPPPLSSIKGASGHSLAASGAIEAVISMIAVNKGLFPANTGLLNVDQELGLTPLTEPLEGSVRCVLSNSFGFGGNNGSVIIGASGTRLQGAHQHEPEGLYIHGCSCLTGAGDLAATAQRLREGGAVAGMAGVEHHLSHLPPQLIRRLKRLPRITLALAAMAQKDCPNQEAKPGCVFMGTGWGALSETCDFLTRLTATNEQFPSPTDFVGSVHNAPASQVAILFGATGANITASGGDYSFEQALLAAESMYTDREKPALLLGADEGHGAFSPLFDASIAPGSSLVDGGGAFCLSRSPEGGKCRITMPFYQSCRADNVIPGLVDSLGGPAEWRRRFALVLVGIPAAMERQGEEQLELLRAITSRSLPLIRYRQFLGEFASASAVATACGVSFIERGVVPAAVAGGEGIVLVGPADTLLVLGLGQYITAITLSPS